MVGAREETFDSQCSGRSLSNWPTAKTSKFLFILQKPGNVVRADDQPLGKKGRGPLEAASLWQRRQQEEEFMFDWKSTDRLSEPLVQAGCLFLRHGRSVYQDRFISISGIPVAFRALDDADHVIVNGHFTRSSRYPDTGWRRRHHHVGASSVQDADQSDGSNDRPAVALCAVAVVRNFRNSVSSRRNRPMLLSKR